MPWGICSGRFALAQTALGDLWEIVLALFSDRLRALEDDGVGGCEGQGQGGCDTLREGLALLPPPVRHVAPQHHHNGCRQAQQSGARRNTEQHVTPCRGV